jgi:hypothetical protein
MRLEQFEDHDTGGDFAAPDTGLIPYRRIPGTQGARFSEDDDVCIIKVPPASS